MLMSGAIRPSGNIELVITEEFAHYIRLLIHFISGDSERSAYKYFRSLDRFLEMEGILIADPKEIGIEGEITFFNFEGLNPEAAVGTQIPLVLPAGDSQMEYVATKLEGDWWAVQDEEDGTPRFLYPTEPGIYSTKEISKYFMVRTPTKMDEEELG